MKTMKAFIKSLIGDYFSFLIFDLKLKYIPNKRQKEDNRKKELENIQRREFYSSFIKPNDLCFDVGANMGNRVRPLLDIGARIVAVEPQKTCQKYLKYKYGNSITIVGNGLAETECIRDFYISNSNVLSSFSDEWIKSLKGRFKSNTWERKVKVEMTTIDKLIEKHGKPVFIKIDVEGYELNVLKGLTRPIKMLSFEYAVPEQTKNVIACIEQINQINAKIVFNYCVGEDMNFILVRWLTKSEMENYIKTNEFLSTGFGDIYAKFSVE